MIRFSLLILAVAWAAGVLCQAESWPSEGAILALNPDSTPQRVPDTVDLAADQHRVKAGVCNLPGVKWVARLGSKAYGAPVIGGGKVLIGTNNSAPRNKKYCGDQGVLMCFDEATGQFAWQLVVPKAAGWPSFDLGQLGIGAAPVVEGQRVYLVTNRDEVLCLDLAGWAATPGGPFPEEPAYFARPGHPPVTLDASDAKIIWRYDMVRELKLCPHDAASCTLVVLGDYLYVGTGNGVNAGHKVSSSPLAPSLIALDKRTGRLAAQDDEKIGTRVFHGQWSSPAIAVVNGQTQVVYGAGDGWCYAFAPLAPGAPAGVATLKKLWAFNANDGVTGHYKTPEGPSEIVATPLCLDQRVYVAVGQDPTHGRGQGRLHCIDASQAGDITRTGKVWTCTQMDRSLATVASAGGLLYAADLSGRLQCLDAATGCQYWEYHSPAPIWGGALVADGKVYCGDEKGGFVILAAGREKKVLSETRFSSGIARAPVAAHSVLFVATHTHLYALAAPRSGPAPKP